MEQETNKQNLQEDNQTLGYNTELVSEQDNSSEASSDSTVRPQQSQSPAKSRREKRAKNEANLVSEISRYKQEIEALNGELGNVNAKVIELEEGNKKTSDEKDELENQLFIYTENDQLLKERLDNAETAYKTSGEAYEALEDRYDSVCLDLESVRKSLRKMRTDKESVESQLEEQQALAQDLVNLESESGKNHEDLMTWGSVITRNWNNSDWKSASGMLLLLLLVLSSLVSWTYLAIRTVTRRIKKFTEKDSTQE